MIKVCYPHTHREGIELEQTCGLALDNREVLIFMPRRPPSTQINPQPPPEPVWRVRRKDNSPASARN